MLKLGQDELYIQHAEDFSNFYYATNLKLRNSAFYVVGRNIQVLMVPDMEKERAIKESKVKNVISFGEIGYHDRLKKLRNSKEALAQTLIEFLKTHKIKKVLIPSNFPAYLALYFIKHFKVEVVENPYLKMRAIKSKEEIEKIKEVSEAVIDAFKLAVELLKKGIKNCDELRDEIEMYLYKRGYLAQDTIVSSGISSSDPHYIGHGEIEGHVVIDIFPKSRRHGYYSDFTRTVILESCAEIEEMLDAVIEAQQKAISMIKDGVIAKDVHHAVCDVLEERGYHTIRKGYNEGFIHSTGHGVGLDVHEEPRIFENDDVLKAGMVLTIEPGLYYRKWGGVRVEDVVVVKKDGCEVLTHFPKKIILD